MGSTLVASLLGLVGLLAGCAAPHAADGQRVAEWVESQEHVLSASSWVSDDPWNKALTIDMVLEPDISDADLLAVTEAAERRGREAGWEHPLIGGTLGEGLSYSNLGGRPTLEIFLALRHDTSFSVFSARGDGDCGGIFCMVATSADPADLLKAVERMLATADDVGGVQSNLDFTASSPDGSILVSAQPDAPVDEAVALLERLDERFEILSADARSIQPVGDIPPSQLLHVVVADLTVVAQVEALAATQTAVEVRARPAP
ncbi:hypothetical protein [Herbiconiux liukaitaii]|uniref:hypothetical protein n=1 Tax=Herbiconiux liukaitaii TaxID=3342799 RepID=UPI0035BB2D90